MSNLDTRRRRLVQGLLGAGVAGIVLYQLHVMVGTTSEVDPLADYVLYHLVLASAAAACVARGVLVRAERNGWLALGAGILVWTVGDLYWTVELGNRDEIPYPSLADVLFLASYPLLYSGIILIVRSRLAHFRASQWLDGLIGALAAAALGVALLAPALIDVGEGNTAAVATNLAYPLADILLLSFVIGALALTVRQGGAWPGREWALLAAGLVVIAIADGLYLHLEATGSYSGGTMDTLWLAGMVLIGFAAWAQTRPAPVELPGYASLLFPSMFAAIALALMVVEVSMHVGWRDSGLPPGALALTAATVAAVILRLVITLGENTRLLEAVRRESETDSLTALGNRRLLLEDLDRILSPDGGRPEVVFALFDLDGFKAYNDSFGHSAGDLLLRRFGRSLAAAMRSTGKAYRLGGDEFCVIAHANGQKPESMVAAATAALSEKGEGFTITSSHGSVLLPYEARDATTALRVADHRMYVQKGRRVESAERQTHDVLISLLREREPELGEHLKGVAKLAVALGREARMSAEDLDILTRAAELHDIGKMAIPDQILHKPGPLDPTEWNLVRSHTLIGQRILEAAAALAPVARVVRSSHERWDGAGYPDGLAGEAIPLASRIVFVCDAFDAMISERPYRERMSVGEALEELRENAGTQFDPTLVELFRERVAPLATTVAGRSGSG